MEVLQPRRVSKRRKNPTEITEKLNKPPGPQPLPPSASVSPPTAPSASGAQSTEIAERRGRGRPKKHVTNSASNVGEGKNSSGRTSFPSPGPSPVLKSQATFLKYWQNLTPLMLSRAKIHVYRKWPVIDRTLTPGNTTQTIEMYEERPPQTGYPKGSSAKCPWTTPEEFQAGMLHHFGSGEYKFIITELGVNGAVVLHDMNVSDPMLPPLLNYSELVMGNPANKSYIDGLRQRSIKLPGDPDYKADHTKQNDEDEQMIASSNAAVDKLADTVIELSRRNNQPQAAPPPSHEDKAGNRGLDLIQEAAKISNEMVSNAQKQASQIGNNQADPLKLLDKVGDIAEKIANRTNQDGGSNAQLLEMQRQMFEQQKEARENERRHNEEMRTRDREELDRLRSLAPGQPKTLLEQLRELEEIDQLLGRKKGKSSGDDDDDEKSVKEGTFDKVVKYAPMVVAGVTTIFAMGANMLHNAAVMRTKTGTPEPPPTPQGQVQEGVDPTTGQVMSPEQQQTLNFLRQIEGPIKRHFFGSGEGLNGATFAHQIYNASADGPKQYIQMKALGVETLTAILSGYAPIWSEIGVDRTRYEMFLDEFMRYEEIKLNWSQGTEIDDGEYDEEEEEPIEGTEPQRIPRKKEPAPVQ